MTLIPRLVALGSDYKAICAGDAADLYPDATKIMIPLPTNHHDFLGPVKVKGKTQIQILQEIRQCS